MRWIPFFIFAYLFVLVQTTLGKILTLERLTIGPVGPDLIVLFAVFLALNIRNVTDGMLVGWVLGTLIDLTTAGGPGSATCVGPMAILFALAVWIIFGLRDAIFHRRALTQMILATAFCLLTHGLWVSAQSLLAAGSISASVYGRMLLQVLLSAVYTGLLMPLVYFLLSAPRGWILNYPLARRRRSRR